MSQKQYVKSASASHNDYDSSDEEACSPVLRDAMKALNSKENTIGAMKRSLRAKKVAKVLRE